MQCTKWIVQYLDHKYEYCVALKSEVAWCVATSSFYFLEGGAFASDSCSLLYVCKAVCVCIIGFLLVSTSTLMFRQI